MPMNMTKMDAIKLTLRFTSLLPSPGVRLPPDFGRGFSRYMPKLVRSNSQAKMRAIGMPPSNRKKISLATHAGRSRIGPTTSVICKSTQDMIM